MTLDDARIRARQRLEELIGADEAAFLVGDRPPGGWDALVTKEHLAFEVAGLRHEMSTMRHEILASLHSALRSQTWRLATALLATVTLTTTAMTAILRLT